MGSLWGEVHLHTTLRLWGPSQRGSRLSTMDSGWCIFHALPAEVSPHLAQHCFFSDLIGLHKGALWTPRMTGSPFSSLQRWQMGKAHPSPSRSQTPTAAFSTSRHWCSIHSSYTCKLSQELTTPALCSDRHQNELAVSVSSATAQRWTGVLFSFLGHLNQLPEPPASTNATRRLTALRSPSSWASPPWPGWKGEGHKGTEAAASSSALGAHEVWRCLLDASSRGGSLEPCPGCGWWKSSSTPAACFHPGCQGSSCTILISGSLFWNCD